MEHPEAPLPERGPGASRPSLRDRSAGHPLPRQRRIAIAFFAAVLLAFAFVAERDLIDDILDSRPVGPTEASTPVPGTSTYAFTTRSRVG